jgi:8-oxo-dGTP pyrophosphatase MutT (NUDIX family)
MTITPPAFLPMPSACPWTLPLLERAHHARWPEQSTSLAALSAQERDELLDIFLRSNMRGHVTGSCLVMDLSSMHALEIFHKASGTWLPPGGHVDPGETARQAALREAHEEVGVDPQTLRVFPGLEDTGGLLDIDTHPIRANPRKSEGAHFHHDCAFAFALEHAFDPALALGEVDAFRWTPLSDMLTSPDTRARRLASKIISLGL